MIFILLPEERRFLCVGKDRYIQRGSVLPAHGKRFFFFIYKGNIRPLPETAAGAVPDPVQHNRSPDARLRSDLLAVFQKAFIVHDHHLGGDLPGTFCPGKNLVSAGLHQPVTEPVLPRQHRTVRLLIGNAASDSRNFPDLLRQGKICQICVFHCHHHIPGVLVPFKIGVSGTDPGEGKKAQHSRKSEERQRERQIGDAQGFLLHLQGISRQLPLDPEQTSQDPLAAFFLQLQPRRLTQRLEGRHPGKFPRRRPGRTEYRQHSRYGCNQQHSGVVLENSFVSARHICRKSVDSLQNTGTARSSKQDPCEYRQRAEGGRLPHKAQPDLSRCGSNAGEDAELAHPGLHGDLKGRADHQNKRHTQDQQHRSKERQKQRRLAVPGICDKIPGQKCLVPGYIRHINPQLPADQSSLLVYVPHILKAQLHHSLVFRKSFIYLSPVNPGKSPDQLQILPVKGSCNAHMPVPLFQKDPLHIIGPEIIKETTEQGQKKSGQQGRRHDRNPG